MTSLLDVNDYVRTVARLRRAGALYRSTRGRAGLYTFLDEVYTIYYRYRMQSITQHKRKLRKAAGLDPLRKRSLSEMVLIIAASKCDRRDRYRWKRLLEAAYRHMIVPSDFVGELRRLRGVNNALSHWSVPPPFSPNPGEKPIPGLEFVRLPIKDIPLAVDGE